MLGNGTMHRKNEDRDMEFAEDIFPDEPVEDDDLTTFYVIVRLLWMVVIPVASVAVIAKFLTAHL